MFALSSKGRLTVRDLGRFPHDTLFDRLARAVCRAGCLPRKELYEAWEVARRVRRLFRGGRVLDLGGGHGLLAHVMLLLDNSSPEGVVVDTSLPASSGKVHEELVRAWPRLAGRIAFVGSTLTEIEIRATDVVVSSHACGTLTDLVLDRAAASRARVAVLPCCHDLAVGDAGGLSGWVDGALAIDIVRATRLAQRGYRIWTQAISADITPKNRLLLGEPAGTVLRVHEVHGVHGVPGAQGSRGAQGARCAGCEVRRCAGARAPRAFHAPGTLEHQAPLSTRHP